MRLGSTEAPAHVSWPVAHRDLEEFRSSLPAVAELAGATAANVHIVAADGSARRVAAELVSANYFSLLGVRLEAGAGLENLPASESDVVVISGGLARDAGLGIGSDLRVNGRVVRVVGIAPSEFRGAELPGRAELWFPLGALQLLDPAAPAGAWTRPAYGVWSLLYGRVAEGATTRQVETQANQLMERIRARPGPNTFSALHYRLQAYDGIGANPTVRASLRGTLRLLSAAAIFLLALALANVINLAAMEASARQGAASIRLALGARRRSLFSQWAIEGILLGLLSGALAVGMAMFLGEGFRQMRLDDYGASLADLRIEPRVLVFTAVLALITSVVAGLPIALATARGSTLAGVGRARTGAGGGRRLRDMLVAAQVALSLVLVVSAGLLVRTISNLRALDPGFEVNGLTVFSIDPALGGYGERTQFLLERIEERIAESGGSAGFIVLPPLRGNWLTTALFPDGGTFEEDMVIGADFRVTPGWIRVLAPQVIAGRVYDELAGDEVVITRNLALRAFPAEPPATVPGRMLRTQDSTLYRVAGVIEDLHLDGLPGEPPPTVLRRLDADALAFGAITGWVRGAAGDISRSIRRAVRIEAPDLPTFELSSARRAIDLLSAERIVMARIFTLLATLGLLLSAVGLYGALGRAVSDRLREYGVRLALGATPVNVLRSVALRGLRLSGLGCAVGLLGAFATSRTLRARLFGIEALDPITYFAGIALVLLIALVASLVPALRATRVSVATVLRVD
jgi:predicted permease